MRRRKNLILRINAEYCVNEIMHSMKFCRRVRKRFFRNGYIEESERAKLELAIKKISYLGTICRAAVEHGQTIIVAGEDWTGFFNKDNFEFWLKVNLDWYTTEY